MTIGRRCAAGAQGGQGAAAGLFSVVIDARHSQEQVDAFCDGLRLFKIGYSWGGPMSLVVPYDLASMRARATPQLKPGTVVRSIGLEAVICVRIRQAMERAFA
jgi:cystathionine beta-lyase